MVSRLWRATVTADVFTGTPHTLKLGILSVRSAPIIRSLRFTFRRHRFESPICSFSHRSR